MVGGFGRFLRADETTKSMTDLRVYRCRVAVDRVSEIPRRLSIVVGDEAVDISIFLESSKRIQGGNADPPPQPPAPLPDAPDDSPRRGPRRDGAGDAGSIVRGDGEGTSAGGAEPAAGLLSSCSVNRRTVARASGSRVPPASLHGGPGAGAVVEPEPPCHVTSSGNDLGVRLALLVGDSASVRSRVGRQSDDWRHPRSGGGNRTPSGGGTDPRRIDGRLPLTTGGPTWSYEVERASLERQGRGALSAATEEGCGAIFLFGVATDREMASTGRCVCPLVKSGRTVAVGDSNWPLCFLSTRGWTWGGVDLTVSRLGPAPKSETCCTGWAGGLCLTLLSFGELGPSTGLRMVRLRIP